METGWIVRPTIDYGDLIEERTSLFNGRGWVLEAIARWLADPDGKRVFLLTGAPGTGKTALAARIVELHEGAAAAGSVPGLPRGVLGAWHFCVAGNTDTLSPPLFVESIAHQLANRFPAYRRALERQSATHYQIAPVTNVHGTVQPGAEVVGAKVAVNITIVGGDAGPLFDQMVRRPLRKLFDAGQQAPVVILVDSLDEALWFGPQSNIPQLLRLAEDFPPQVRFLLTCRANNQRVFELVGPSTLDLVGGAPSGRDEIGDFAYERLARVAEPARRALADRISQASNGNFLYARHVLRELEDAPLDETDASAIELPDSLEAIYRKMIERGLASNPTRWRDAYRPVLGLIAVARGDGLTRQRLIDVTGLAEDVADDVISTCSQYLIGGSDDRPVRLYHQSFRDFLLGDRDYGVVAHERHEALARFLEHEYGGSWANCRDDYALRFTPAHWADAALLADTKREVRTLALVSLLERQDYQESFERRARDLGELQQHWQRAVAAASRVQRAEGLTLLLRAARGHVGFRRDYLQGESIVRLAQKGELARAESRLRLFTELSDDWQKAARLLIAWLGASAAHPEAERLLEQGTSPSENDALLLLLAQRLAAELGLQADPPPQSARHEPLDVMQEVVRRMGGQEYDQELLMTRQAELLGDHDFASKDDGPSLVGAALDHGDDGTELLDKYVDAHAGYNYVEYRNQSLWFVLDAVLRCHPDRAWVRARLGRILAAALTGGGTDFCDMLPLTVKLLAAADRRAVLDPVGDKASTEARALKDKRGADDAWGLHRRRHTALFELTSLLLEDGPAADGWLAAITNLPGGFAGYQAPARLRVADALWATGRPAHPLRQRSLDDALGSAHHIQDYHFCARMTARCNALRRWHALPLDAAALSATIRRLAEAPASIEFAPEHRIHETFGPPRDKPGMLSVLEATRADTLELLADVFQRPAVEFRRLNPTVTLDEKIAGGTTVHVPDPGFAPLLAVHLAARCMSEPALDDDRADLVRSLVPVAVANATTLDSVLAYLLIATRPGSRALLDELVELTRPPQEEAAPAPAKEPPAPVRAGIPT